MSELVAKFPPKTRFLFKPSRYKVLYGGRGSGKSWAMARALLLTQVQGNSLGVSQSTADDDD